MRIELLLSHGHRLCRFARRRNKRNKGNLHPPLRSPFCHFCSFCGTLLFHADNIYCPTVIGFAASLVEEMKEIKEILVSDVASGRPSASKLQGQELQKVKFLILRPEADHLLDCWVVWGKGLSHSSHSFYSQKFSTKVYTIHKISLKPLFIREINHHKVYTKSTLSIHKAYTKYTQSIHKIGRFWT